MPFQNLITIITGGASGIGRALVDELARRGATVVIADVSLPGAQQVVAEIAAAGGAAFAPGVDVGHAPTCRPSWTMWCNGIGGWI